MKRHFLMACAVLLASETRADVVVEYRSNADMANIVSLKMEGIENIKGDRSYSAVTTSVDGGMMAMMGNAIPKKTATIVRLDKGLCWELDHEKKTYKESSLEALGRELLQNGEAGNQGNENDYDWTVEMAPLNTNQSFNGLDCSGFMGKAVGTKKENPGDTVFITYEQWFTKSTPAGLEVKAYQSRYAEIVGVSRMWAQGSMSSMLKGYGPQFEIMADSMNRQDGFPVKTVILIESSVVDNEESPDKGMEGMMRKMLKSKESSEGGRTKAFSLTTEVLSVEQRAIDDGRFEIPKGYAKQ